MSAGAEDRRVLCVDDEPCILSALQRQLRREHLDLVAVGDPRTALRLHQESPARLLVTDLLMPHMNGLELIAAVRERSASTRCVLLTGYPKMAASLGARASGVDTFLLKPWEAHELQGAIHQFLGPPEERMPGVLLRSPDFREWMVSIDCGGKASAEVLEEADWMFGSLELRRRGVILVLKNIPRLRDSMLRLLRDLYFRLSSARLSATVVEPTGLSIVAHDALGGLLPVSASSRRVGRAGIRRILVADRREAGREFLRALLTSAGHACRVAESAREAAIALASLPFDLAWLDESLGAAETAELARPAAALSPRLRVVTAGGEAWAPIAQAVPIRKPLRAIDVLQAIR